MSRHARPTPSGLHHPRPPMGIPLNLNNWLPWQSPWAPLDPPCNTWFLGPIRVHSPNSKSIGSAVSAELTAESAYTLQWGPFPQKLPLLVGDGDSHLFHDSLRHTEPTMQTASRSVRLYRVNDSDFKFKPVVNSNQQQFYISMKLFV